MGKRGDNYKEEKLFVRRDAKRSIDVDVRRACYMARREVGGVTGSVRGMCGTKEDGTE